MNRALPTISMEWQLTSSASRSEQPRSMENRQTANWRLRIGFVLSAMVSLAWGLLLGWTEIRVNAWLSPLWALFVGMPIAFFGRVIVVMVAHRMLLSWHKFARLLV